MNARERLALAGALVLTLLIGGALVWFVNTDWQRLPPWLVVILCLLLAVFAIGSPIWALARWSGRWLERQQRDRAQRHD